MSVFNHKFLIYFFLINFIFSSLLQMDKISGNSLSFLTVCPGLIHREQLFVIW